MSADACTTLTDGCYRCDLNRDEMASAEQEIAADAQEAWLIYRDQYMRSRAMSARAAASQMRRREFIAGYLAANR